MSISPVPASHMPGAGIQLPGPGISTNGGVPNVHVEECPMRRTLVALDKLIVLYAPLKEALEEVCE